MTFRSPLFAGALLTLMGLATGCGSDRPAPAYPPPADPPLEETELYQYVGDEGDSGGYGGDSLDDLSAPEDEPPAEPEDAPEGG